MISKVKLFRQELHDHPEPSMKEVETRLRIQRFLKEYTNNLMIVDKGNWFYAVHDEGASETYLFRADFDAILHEDGSSFHGCGHDGHTAILAGLAIELDGVKLGRNIVFLFQHAEETGQGAIETVGIFDDWKIKYAFALHGWPGKKLGSYCLRDGTAFCASTGLKIKMKGIQSHASEPEKGNNPAYLIADIVRWLEPLSAFEGFKKMEFDGQKFCNLVMATIVYQRLGEVAFGVSPSLGEIGLTIRAYHEEEMDKLIMMITQHVKKLANERGIELSIESTERFPETSNDTTLFQRVVEFLKTEGIKYTIEDEPVRSSEDFGHIAKHTPSCFFLLGLGENNVPLHHVDFNFPDEAIQYGIRLFGCIAIKGL